jgi:hypothetical protein
MSTMTNPDGEVVTATYDADGVRAADHRPPTAVCGMIGGQWSAVTRS